MDQRKPQILGGGRARRRVAANLVGRPEMADRSLMVYRQLGKNLIVLVSWVASLGHHGNDQRPGRRYGVGGRVNEPLLDGCPLIRITLPRDTGQRTDIKSRGPPTATHHYQRATHQGTDHDDDDQGDNKSSARQGDHLLSG